MIHEAFKKTEIARMYYKKRGIELDKEPARKRFFLDKNIDRKLLREVFTEIYKEQMLQLKYR
jgi:hypothetical protein